MMAEKNGGFIVKEEEKANPPFIQQTSSAFFVCFPS